MVFSSLKVSRLTFTLRPLPGSAGQMLSPEVLVMVGCQELWLLTWLEIPSQRRGWTTGGVSRKLWSPLPSVPLPTSASMLQMGIPSLRPAINLISLSCLPFRSIYFHPLHPLLDILCSSRGPHYFCHSTGTSWPPCLSSLFTTALALAWQPFCRVSMVTSTWVALLFQLMESIKLNPTSLVFPKESPSLHDWHPRNGIVSPGASTTTLVISASKPSWNISTINKPLQAWEGGD